MPTSTALGCVHCPPTRMLSAPTMTAQRQERNGSRREIGFRPGIALIALAGGPWRAGVACGSRRRPRPPSGWSSTASRVWPSRASTPSPISPTPVPKSACRSSRPSQAGAVWRFRNEGNRASFVAHPDIYGPQFGGYDPIDVARGVTVAGNPRFWLVSGSGSICSAASKAAMPLPPTRRACCARPTQRWPALEQNAGAVAHRSLPLDALDQLAAAGSPQAMNSGTIKSSRPGAEVQRRRRVASVILPPAAVTMAWPAAMSHSQVGARRG